MTGQLLISPCLYPGRLPSDIMLAPDNLKSLHPTCIEKAFSAGSENGPLLCPRESPTRSTPGIRAEPLELSVIDAASEACCWLKAVAPGEKLSKSDVALSDAPRRAEPSCVTSPAHILLQVSHIALDELNE